MADSKVSGLPAVAAFAAAQEFPVNDSGTSRKITGAQLIAAVAQGTTSTTYVPVTVNQGSITTIVDLTSLTLTITTVAGRRYRITGYTFPSSTIANDQAGLVISDGSGTQLAQASIHMPIATQGDTLIAHLVHVPGAGSRVYKLRMLRGNGTGTITNNASPTNASFIMIEDIGT